MKTKDLSIVSMLSILCVLCAPAIGLGQQPILPDSESIPSSTGAPLGENTVPENTSLTPVLGPEPRENSSSGSSWNLNMPRSIPEPETKIRVFALPLCQGDTPAPGIS